MSTLIASYPLDYVNNSRQMGRSSSGFTISSLYRYGKAIKARKGFYINELKIMAKQTAGAGGTLKAYIVDVDNTTYTGDYAAGTSLFAGVSGAEIESDAINVSTLSTSLAEVTFTFSGNNKVKFNKIFGITFAYTWAASNQFIHIGNVIPFGGVNVYSNTYIEGGSAPSNDPYSTTVFDKTTGIGYEIWGDYFGPTPLHL